MSSKSEVFKFSRRAEAPIKGGYMWPAMPIFKFGLAIPIKSHVWKFGSDWLSLSRVIIWIFRGGRNPLLGGCKWPAMPIFGLGWAIPVKSHLCKFGLDWLSLSRVIVSTNIFLWGRHPLLGGLHLNCDAHFWTRMSYSSQKSCVEIWFGLIEIRSMLILRGGYMWPAMPIFELCRGCLDKSHVWKFGSDWLRLSRVIVRKKQMTRGRVRGRG